MRNVVAGLLLVLDLLLIAVVVVAVVGAVVRLAGRLLRRGRPQELQVRRCDSCRRIWRGDPDHDLGRVELVVRRRARRKARAAERAVPEWARARGWTRCPSCLSSKVRSQGDPEDSRATAAR